MRRRDRISRSGSGVIREAPARHMTSEEIRGYERSDDPLVRSLALSALAGSGSARVRLAQEIERGIEDAIGAGHVSRTHGPW